MIEQRRGKVLWDVVALVALAIVGAVLLVVWVESRFSATIAILTLGAIGGTGLFISGAWMFRGMAKDLLVAQADMLHETGQTGAGMYKVLEQMFRFRRDSLKREAEEIEFQKQQSLLQGPPTYAAPWSTDQQPQQDQQQQSHDVHFFS